MEQNGEESADSSLIILEPNPLPDSNFSETRFDPVFSRSPDSVETIVLELGEVRAVNPAQKKIPWYNFFIPGLGYWKLGLKTRAKLFFKAEVAIWSLYTVLQQYSQMKKEEGIHYAVIHAGVNPAGKNDQYWKDIEKYKSLSRSDPTYQGYNYVTHLWDRENGRIYPENDYWSWEWDSPGSFKEYKEKMKASRLFYQNSLFMFGAAVVNRVVSLVDARRLSRKMEITEPHLYPESRLFLRMHIDQPGLQITYSFY